MQNAVALGLEGVTVAETELSLVDGERGRLVLRGYEVEDAAERLSFAEVCGLFLDGEPRDLSTELGEARAFAFDRIERLGDALEAADAMDALRSAISHLPPGEGDRATAIRAIGAAPVFAAAWARKRAGQLPVAPEPSAPHAADYLHMLHGRADSSWVEALDRYLVTVSDHGMNASTFAARVVASTESDLISATVAAIGALKGRLHGGAPGPVLTMLDEIGTIDRARAHIEAELDAGRRIMGLGHRIYRVRDPRAHVLERAIELLAGGGADPARLALARAVERISVELLTERKPDRPLRANVEFYTAVLLEAVGIDRALFTATFACGRAAGWAAHVIEQRRQKKLIRPSSRYVGPNA
jgi:citrate synthase